MKLKIASIGAKETKPSIYPATCWDKGIHLCRIPSEDDGHSFWNSV